jgi:glucosamine-6-phosphate deaminase
MTIKLASPNGYASHEAMCEAAAARIIDLVLRKPNAVIGLATGGTMEPLYAAVVRKYQESQNSNEPVSFKHVKFFTLDEYVGLPRAHPQSYHSYLHRHLLSHIDAKLENIDIPNGNAPDTTAECKRYEAAIAKAGGADVWLAGIGPNGHVAFNEPGSKFTGETRKVKLTQATREANSRFFEGDVKKVPTHAISVGLGTLKKHAREVLLLANGETKSQPLSVLLEGRVRQTTPATMLTTMPNVTVFADARALSIHHANQAGRGAGR